MLPSYIDLRGLCWHAMLEHRRHTQKYNTDLQVKTHIVVCEKVQEHFHKPCPVNKTHSLEQGMPVSETDRHDSQEESECNENTQNSCSIALSNSHSVGSVGAFFVHVCLN